MLDVQARATDDPEARRVLSVLADPGQFAGDGLVWSLLLASLVPPSLWWAVRSTRRTG